MKKDEATLGLLVVRQTGLSSKSSRTEKGHIISNAFPVPLGVQRASWKVKVKFINGEIKDVPLSSLKKVEHGI